TQRAARRHYPGSQRLGTDAGQSAVAPLGRAGTGAPLDGPSTGSVWAGRLAHGLAGGPALRANQRSGKKGGNKGAGFGSSIVSVCLTSTNPKLPRSTKHDCC